MKTFIVLAKEDGGIEMTDYQRATYRQFIKKNKAKKIRLILEELSTESDKQRKFYHGAVLTLWAYLDGNDYRSSVVVKQYHEYAKQEFTPEIMVINGKPVTYGKSSKGNLNYLVEKTIEYLMDNYGIDPAKVLNVELYKKFRDTVYPFTTEYDTFIDYMTDLKLL